MSTSESRRLQLNQGWSLTIGIGLLLCLVWAAVLQALGTGEAGWRIVVRNSARTTLLLLLLILPASALARRWPGRTSAWLVRNRRYLGVAAAFSHLLHLGAIFGLYGLRLFEVRSPWSLAAGAIPYALLFAMALTSSDRALRALGGRRWRRLHVTGLYLVSAVFVVAYAGRSVRQPLPWNLPALSLLLVALALRLRKPRPAL